ncbi:hypothetical protein [Tritonibacter scottomollicae]|uniref:Uncharacterized protein n=1 Tax=Tritonibacter scottomollicae TaxID=483013 RepID=A0A2T1A0G1_TRISK|nr:hypothetical protein [Tritonibacter scottomollicae]PRZ42092.1 hypothetical protein CLV89_1385 [Tritonibacter scottomollicae]
MVFTLDPDGDPIQSYGHLYKPDSDFEAISADLIATEEPVAAYLQKVFGDAQPPIKMLLQFDRVSGRFNVQFEDKDESRWQVRPADIHGYIEELRPKFDQ